MSICRKYLRSEHNQIDIHYLPFDEKLDKDCLDRFDLRYNPCMLTICPMTNEDLYEYGC